MAKVFTITDGLENMGAIKTGGQGSVYKGKRIGEIISAIKILPTPIYSESSDDKNYVAFLNEVIKLKKVNEDPNPNVVKILNSGITESGNLPFIEMEFVEGPDLEELLRPPHDSVFSIKEAVKVAEQLSSALAHCHKADVRHGDVKSNNVKYNIHTGNYVLLDFGLAVMSDEQRRTSLRHAGAIEFMAPEQNDGKMLFETDVYSFGVVLFELIAGSVPFPLNDRGETGRNMVMVAHMEKPPPDLITLRRQCLPESWSNEKKEQEMQVPEWLISLIYKCLEKKPADRFANGIELYDYISHNAIRSANGNALIDERISFLEEENKRLRKEREELQQQLLQHHTQTTTDAVNSSTKISIPKHTFSRHVSASKPSRFSLNRVLIYFTPIIIIGVIFFVFVTNKTEPTTATEAFKKTSNEGRFNAAKTTNAAENHSAEVRAQLQNAKEFLSNRKMVEALIIYSSLSQRQVPEAMYYYGKLALQNKNQNITCAEAFDLLKKAADKGYAPAKRTVGFLYAFADDKEALQQANYYQRCVFSKNVAKGSSLLMQAMLEGDTAAARMIDDLNLKR
jgi:serine/threonine-protein kinase